MPRHLSLLAACIYLAWFSGTMLADGCQKVTLPVEDTFPTLEGPVFVLLLSLLYRRPHTDSGISYEHLNASKRDC